MLQLSQWRIDTRLQKFEGEGLPGNPPEAEAGQCMSPLFTPAALPLLGACAAPPPALLGRHVLGVEAAGRLQKKRARTGGAPSVSATRLTGASTHRRRLQLPAQAACTQRPNCKLAKAKGFCTPL